MLRDVPGGLESTLRRQLRLRDLLSLLDSRDRRRRRCSRRSLLVPVLVHALLTLLNHHPVSLAIRLDRRRTRTRTSSPRATRPRTPRRVRPRAPLLRTPRHLHPLRPAPVVLIITAALALVLVRIFLVRTLVAPLRLVQPPPLRLGLGRFDDLLVQRVAEDLFRCFGVFDQDVGREARLGVRCRETDERLERTDGHWRGLRHG